MKKIVLALGTLAALSAVITGSWALYIYNLDLGVDYKGRARLDYNWKYNAAFCPKEGHKYEGKLFSFSYPRFGARNPLNEIVDLTGGFVSDGYLLTIFWKRNTEGRIKSELLSYLSYPSDQVLPAPSPGFEKWLLGDGIHKLVHVDKIYFKRGGAAVFISEKDSRHDYMLGVTPVGDVFQVVCSAKNKVPEELYRDFMFTPVRSCTVSPDPARDAKSACVLNMFLRTFEFKK